MSWGWLLALQQAFFPDFVTQYKLYVLLSERQGVIFTKGNLLWTRSHSFKIKPYLDLTFYFFFTRLKTYRYGGNEQNLGHWQRGRG